MFKKQADTEARKLKRRQEKEIRKQQKSMEVEKPSKQQKSAEIEKPSSPDLLVPPKVGKRQRLDSNITNQSKQGSVVSSGAKTDKKSLDLPARGRKLNMDAPTPKVQTPKQDFKKPEIRSTRSNLFEAGKLLGKEIVMNKG